MRHSIGIRKTRTFHTPIFNSDACSMCCGGIALLARLVFNSIKHTTKLKSKQLKVTFLTEPFSFLSVLSRIGLRCYPHVSGLQTPPTRVIGNN